jgi:hypothetical protein
MKLKIIPGDNIFWIDNVSKKGFTFSVDSNIHAVTWNETHGEIEYKETFENNIITKKPNLLLYDIGDFQTLIDEWINFEEEEDSQIPSYYDPQIYNTIQDIHYSIIVNEAMAAKEYEDKEQVIDTVGFQLVGVLGNKKRVAHFSWKFPIPENTKDFIEFENLTETNIIDWLYDDIDEEEMIRMKYVVAEDLYQSNYDEVYTLTLPWRQDEMEVIDPNLKLNTMPEMPIEAVVESSNTQTQDGMPTSDSVGLNVVTEINTDDVVESSNTQTQI